MDIACNIDRNYIKCCVVMLVSLFQNNERGSIHAHILTGDLSEDDMKLMHQELDRYGNTLTFHNVGHKIVENFPLSEDVSRIPLAAYYRIFLPLLLPESLSKVLYLDCDLVVESSVAELWQTDLSGYALAAAEDCRCGMQALYDRLHYDKEHSYFNAGVLLINLDYWREHLIMEQCTEYIRNYPERLKFNDQDVLNGVLHGQWLSLAYKWNMHYYFRKTVMSPKALEKIKQSLATPAILHYISSSKPWLPHCTHPLAARWFHYSDHTRWKGERPRKTFKDFVYRYIKPIGYRIGMDKPRYIKIN